MGIVTRYLSERILDGKRLGRHVEHDERSRNYAFRVSVNQFKTVHHRHYGSILNQNGTSACTGNGTANAINSHPLHIAGHRLLRETDALQIYTIATELDEFPGTYPAEDTGSSGLAAAKAAVQLGYINSYRHAFTTEDALGALQLFPVITGVNWYEGFDYPDAGGYVQVAGDIRGGHEFCILGFQREHTVEDSLVIALNSWGPDWGKRGLFNFTVSTWERLLSEEGDVTILGV